MKSLLKLGFSKLAAGPEVLSTPLAAGVKAKLVLPDALKKGLTEEQKGTLHPK